MVVEGLRCLADAQERFARYYGRHAANGCLALELPTALCTIYDTPPSAPNHRIIRTALSVFNDIITRAAFGEGLPLIDLRLICNEEDDYANPIEPSAQGGAKMAHAIAGLIAGGGGGPRSVVVAA
jgi:hypothetical protein